MRQMASPMHQHGHKGRMELQGWRKPQIIWNDCYLMPSPVYYIQNIIHCPFFKRSHWDCPYLLFSITHLVSLAWGKYKVEALKIYCSGLLLKRDSGTYCATLVSPPCPVFCNVWVLATSSAICVGSLCLLGFCLKSSKTVTNFPKHSPCLWCDSLSPHSHSKFAHFFRPVKHLLLNAKK